MKKKLVTRVFITSNGASRSKQKFFGDYLKVRRRDVKSTPRANDLMAGLY